MRTLEIGDIAKLVHKTPRTVREDIHRRPHSLPPRLIIPGSAKILWLESDVQEWINKCREGQIPGGNANET